MNRCPKPTDWLLHAAGELSPRRRRDLDAHLAACETCRAESASLARGLAALETLDRQPAVRAEAMESLRRRLGVAAAHRAARPAILTVVWRHRWAAAAAVILVAAVAWTLAPGPKGPLPATLAPTAAAQPSWVTDIQVQEEIAEITAGVEMLESGLDARTCEATAPRAEAPVDPAIDEMERFIEQLRADLDA
jgi:anti-sigma factor RsiW